MRKISANFFGNFWIPQNCGKMTFPAKLSQSFVELLFSVVLVLRRIYFRIDESAKIMYNFVIRPILIEGSIARLARMVLRRFLSSPYSDLQNPATLSVFDNFLTPVRIPRQGTWVSVSELFGYRDPSVLRDLSWITPSPPQKNTSKNRTGNCRLRMSTCSNMLEWVVYLKTKYFNHNTNSRTNPGKNEYSIVCRNFPCSVFPTPSMINR